MLPLALLRLADGLSDRALADIAQAGGPKLRRSEALVFAFIQPTGSTTVELARAAGMTKQSMHSIVVHLTELGLLEPAPRPGDHRARPVRLSAQGRRVAAQARRTFQRLERRLERRVGVDSMMALHCGLAAIGDELMTGAHDG